MPKEPFNLGERLKDYNKILSDLPIMNEIFPYTATTVVIDTNILLSELYWMLLPLSIPVGKRETFSYQE